MQRPQLEHIVVSKLVAGREKDLGFVGGLFRPKLARSEIVRERLNVTALDETGRQLCLERLRRLHAP